MYSRDLGERVNRGDKRGVTRPPRILFLPFFKREARLHLSWRRGGVLRRNCERIQPAIGRCIPADLSAALSPPATGLRYRWSFPIFYTDAGDLSARFATLARLAPPPPIISDRPTLPVGQRLETDSLPRFIARPFTPPLCLLPVPQEDACFLRSFLLIPNNSPDLVAWDRSVSSSGRKKIIR